MPPSSEITELLRQIPVTIQKDDDLDHRLNGLLLGKISSAWIVLLVMDDHQFPAGESIIVRTIQGGKAVGFKTTVHRSIAEPANLLFCDLPRGVEEISLRKSGRLELFLPSDLRYTDKSGGSEDTVMLRANMVDISNGGCRVFTKRPIPAETQVNISFTLPGEKRLVTLAGSVLDAFPRESVFGQRIKFFTSQRNLTDLAEIRRWITQHEEYIGLDD
jgi:hypothetical protein